MKNRCLTLLSLSFILFCCIAISCRKSSQRRTTTYDFSWAYQQPPGIPSYASEYYFHFSSTAPASSTFLWNFGDGTTETFYEPIHIFKGTGTYRVSLTINGDIANTIVKYIHVGYYLSHTFSYTGTTLPDSVLRFASNVSPDSSFYWEFGDGTSSTDSMPSHAYAASGTYSVRLTINGHTGDAVTMPVEILNDPGHTSAIGRSRSWHHGDSLLFSSGDHSFTQLHDTTFALTYVNPITVRFGSSLLTYDSHSSTGTTLIFYRGYTDNTGRTLGTSIFFNYATDSIVIVNDLARSAGGVGIEIWNTY